MSLLAIISDIHANIDALDAVMEDVDTRKVDGIICLGDVVGYGAAPAECVVKGGPIVRRVPVEKCCT